MRLQKWVLLLGFLAFCLVFLLMGCGVFYFQQQCVGNLSRTLALEAEAIATTLERQNNNALSIVELLGRVQKDHYWGKREETHHFCQDLLEVNPEVNAIFVIYEPNADGLDASFSNKSKRPVYIGSEGQFASLWTRDRESGGRTLPAEFWSSTLAKEYRHMKTVLLQQEVPLPTFTEPQNDALMNTSVYCLIPLICKGAFAGACGVHVHLSPKCLRNISIYRNSGIFVLSPQQRIIISSLPKLFDSVHIEDLYLSDEGSMISDIYENTLDGQKRVDPKKELLLPRTMKSTMISEWLHHECAQATLNQVACKPGFLGQMRILVSSLRISSTGWYLISYVPEALASRQFFLHAWPLFTLVVGLLSFVFFMTIAAITKMQIQELRFIASLKAVAKGDLSASYFDSALYTGNFEEIALYAKKMVLSMGKSIRNLNDLVDFFVGELKVALVGLSGGASAYADLIETLQDDERVLTTLSSEFQQTGQSLHAFDLSIQHMSGSLETSSHQLLTFGEELQKLAYASELFSSRLNLINDKAQSIYKVINLIDVLRDQTCILSLNVSIEAESASEPVAQSFLALAPKVSFLAEQTSSVSEQVGERVKELHAAVFSGVAELDTFAQSVQKVNLHTQKIVSDWLTMLPGFQALMLRVTETSKKIEKQGCAFEEIAHHFQNLRYNCTQQLSLIQGSMGQTEKLYSNAAKIKTAFEEIRSSEDR